MTQVTEPRPSGSEGAAPLPDGRGSDPGPARGGAGAGTGQGPGLFPVPPTARTVVYVLDRSLSMWEHGTLELARTELLASLHRLPATTRFQVIPYNLQAQPLYVNESFDLLTADPATLGRVEELVRELQASGNTNHMQALRRGLQFRPDVLYLITDGDQISLEEVDDITRFNQGRSVIHAVELSERRSARPDSPLRSPGRVQRGHLPTGLPPGVMVPSDCRRPCRAVHCLILAEGGPTVKWGRSPPEVEGLLRSAPLRLLDVLAQVPDPPNPRGVRHPLRAILALTVLAMLTGAKSYTAIAQFGRDQGAALAFALGFRRRKTATKSSLSKLFRRLDVTAFEAALVPLGNERRRGNQKRRDGGGVCLAGPRCGRCGRRSVCYLPVHEGRQESLQECERTRTMKALPHFRLPAVALLAVALLPVRGAARKRSPRHRR